MASPSPHDRSRKAKEEEEEEDPVDAMVERSGCARPHWALQECMAEHQDWRRCQGHVQAFRDCMNTFQKARGEALRKQHPGSLQSSPG